METKNFLKAAFVKTVKTTINRCLAPGYDCENKSIKAHSVQKRKVLEILNTDGHVIMPQEKIINKGENFSVSFDKVGINDATTFTGLCKIHDPVFFSPIDNFDIDLSNSQQLFLITYRAVLKKFHSLARDALQALKTYENLAMDEKNPYYDEEMLSNWTAMQHIKAFGAFRYKSKFDDIYLSHQYDMLKHKCFVFQHKKPTIAVSALYWLEMLKSDNSEPPGIAINVFPTLSETNIIISYLVEDTEYVNSEIESLVNPSLSSLKRRLCLLSEKIIGLSDNFVIAPAYWNSLSKQKRNTIVKYYQNTLISRAPYDGNVQDLYLFELADKYHSKQHSV